MGYYTEKTVYIGKVSVNVLPLSGSEVTVICPLCNTVICLHNASPMPEPPGLVVKKGRKIRSVTSGSIPSPLSVMVNSHCLSAMWAFVLAGFLRVFY